MSKANKIDELFWKILEIRKAVNLGEKLGRAITDPLEMYNKVLNSTSGLLKHADEDLKRLLKVAVEGKEFAKAFTNRSRCADATWLLEHLTQASAGADAANRSSLVFMNELRKHCVAVQTIAETGNEMVTAVAIMKNINIKDLAKNLSSVKVGADVMAVKEIKAMNSFTIRRMSSLIPEIDIAIGWLKVM